MEIIQLKSCAVDLSRGVVSRDLDEVRLSAMEIKLMRFFVQRTNQVVSREHVLAEVWGYKPNLRTRADSSTVLRLRAKIESNAGEPDHLRTLHGVGYRFDLQSGGDQGLKPAKSEVSATLTAPPNDLFGRDQALQELSDYFSDQRWLVTIKGTAGVGKTRLAVEYGWRQQVEHGQTVCFCDLRRANAEEDILAVMGHTLGIALAGDDGAITAQIGRAIAARASALLILDNAEHVSKALAARIRGWRVAAPKAQWLVTTRHRLHLPGEQLMELSPLLLPEKDQPIEENAAIQMFVARAKEVNPSLQVDDKVKADIATIVRVVEGLPLAIELAAARMQVLSAASLRTRLADRFAVLRRPRTNAETGHSTLWAALEWSWERLSIPEQQALAQCAVFRGGFTITAAEAVVNISECEEIPETLDILTSLMDQSLLHIRDTSYGMRLDMYATVAEFAGRKLSDMGPSLETAAAHRHAAHFSGMGAPSHVAHQLSHVDRPLHLTCEVDNLYAASRRALSEQWLEEALGASEALWRIRRLIGPFGPVRSLYRRFLQLKGIGEARRSYVLGILGAISAHMGHWQAALDFYLQSLSIYREQGNHEAEGSVLRSLSSIAGSMERWADGLAYIQQALTLARRAGDRQEEGYSLGVMGIMHSYLNDNERALACTKQALAIQQEVGNRRSEGFLHNNLAKWFERQGLKDEALAHYQEAIGILHTMDDQTHVGAILANLGTFHGKLGLFDEARANFSEGGQLLEDAGDPINFADLLCKQGQMELFAGNHSEARNALRKAETLIAPLGLSDTARVCRRLAALNNSVATASVKDPGNNED